MTEDGVFAEIILTRITTVIHGFNLVNLVILSKKLCGICVKDKEICVKSVANFYLTQRGAKW